jgi:hypothetical protein
MSAHTAVATHAGDNNLIASADYRPVGAVADAGTTGDTHILINDERHGSSSDRVALKLFNRGGNYGVATMYVPPYTVQVYGIPLNTDVCLWHAIRNF